MVSVKDRLSRLRSQTGATAPPAEEGDRPEESSPPVGERMRQLRPVHPAPRRSGGRASPEELARRVGGEMLASGLILVERRLPLSARHGRFPLIQLAAPVQGLPEAEGIDPREALFLDTETSGLAGGTGTVAFMVGLLRVEASHLMVRQYLLTGFGGERAMLESLSDWIGWARALVTFNGKSFDAPLLATRYRLAGVADPLARLRHVDLLHPTRRAFGQRWEDCRLTTAEARLFGFEREDDLPGAEAPFAWFDYIHRGDPRRLPLVSRHNHWDLLSLAALLPALAAAHRDPMEWRADALAVARAHLKAGAAEHALTLLEAHRDKLSHEGLLQLAWLYRRHKAWKSACAVWEELAAGGCVESIEHLAKYHEHVGRDPARALDYARLLPSGERHDDRRRRLNKKAPEGGLTE